MKTNTQRLRRLVEGMRLAFGRGENAMAWARANERLSPDDSIDAALIAYDLQAGSYSAIARNDPAYRNKWCAQLGALIKPWIEPGDRILEVGVGEATTLSGVVSFLAQPTVHAMGFDLSWSRVHVGRNWLKENSAQADLFVADLFNIPLADRAVDLVYTSHSLEPNGGREAAAIAECLRVARKAVVLIEPIYELATEAAKQRMISHGYVRNLKQTATDLGAEIRGYGLLEVCANPLNPSGVLVLGKTDAKKPLATDSNNFWQCPVTGAGLVEESDVYYAPDVGLAYPVLRSVPLLRAEHAVVSSQLVAAANTP